jgi:arsenite methyltransferase
MTATTRTFIRPSRFFESKRLALIAPAFLLLFAACGGMTKIDYTTLGRGGWQRPDEVVAALALQPGDHVADLGAGEGFFIPYLSRAVGANGRVYAIEVDPERVEELKQEFVDGNVEVVLAAVDDPRLPSGAVDVVLIVNTFHHISDRSTYFSKLRETLRSGGRVAVIEPNAELGGILSLALDEGHKSSASDVVQEMQEAGYRKVESFDFLPVQIFEMFTPASRQASD